MEHGTMVPFLPALETILIQTLLPRGLCQLRVVQGPSLFPSIFPKEILCR